MELLIYNGGLFIKYMVAAQIDFFEPIVGPDYALYYNQNFWIAAGIHTGWNYVQSYIFSIEASGHPVADLPAE